MAAAPESVVLELDACAALRADLAARGAGARPWATEAAVGGAGEEGGRAGAPDAGDPGDPDDAARAAAWLPLVVGLERGARLTRRERPAHFRRQQPAWAAAAEALGEARYDRVGRRLARWRAPEPRLPLVQELLWALEQPEAAGFTRLALAGLSALAGLVSEEDVRLGYVLAQSARAVRTLGSPSQALERYAHAEELGRMHRHATLCERIAIGLGTTFGHIGNYPAARAAYRRVFESVHPDPRLAAAAHHGLLCGAIVARDWNTALEHGWELLRASRTGTIARVEVLNLMAELCNCIGRHRTAERAALAALRLAVRPDHSLMALAIVVEARIALNDRPGASESGGALQDHLGRSAGPFEDARGTLALAKLSMYLGDRVTAAQHIENVRVVAARFKYHQLQFEVEAFDEHLAHGVEMHRGQGAELSRHSLQIACDIDRLDDSEMMGTTAAAG